MFAATLTTERLILRPPRLEDAGVIFERYASDPEVTHFLSWVTHTCVEETKAFLSERLESMVERNETRWVIGLGEDPSPRGMITAWRRETRVELGYYLDRSLWGQGVMTESVEAVQQEVWRDRAVWRLQAYCHTQNTGSAQVLEKCGLRREGIARRIFHMPQISEEPQDCFLYAQVRDDVVF